MAIIGQEIEDYVADQINFRQKLHGSGTSYSSGNEWITDYRTEAQIALLNSNTSWIKLASGVSIAANKLNDLGLSSAFSGMELAKANILYAGLSTLQGGDHLTQRGGFNPEDAIYSKTYGGEVNASLQDPNSKTYKGSYTYGTYGFSPMPGIISADIKALNRGSLKKATVKIKVNNKQQFDIIDVLYLRLGYTVMLEWGNTLFTKNGVDKDVVRNTIIDDPKRFFSSGFGSNRSYRDLLYTIEYYRKEYVGNYDGLLGKISNFNWSFNKDGSYDIEITIISLGDVVESLKMNVSSDQKFQEFLELQQASPTPTSNSNTPPEPDPIEENKDANAISSMLWAWKYSNETELQSYQNNGSGNDIHIIDGNGGINYVGSFLKNSKTLTASNVTYKFTYTISPQTMASSPREQTEANVEYKPEYETFNAEVFLDPLSTAVSEKADELLKAKADAMKYNKNGNGAYVKVVDKRGSIDILEELSISYFPANYDTPTVESPIADAPPKSACFLITEPKQLYLRFGYLLHFISKNLIPRVNVNEKHDSNPSMFKMRYDINDGHKQGFTQVMYSIPNQISLDPRVCIVKNKKVEKEAGTNNAYDNLLSFRTADYVTGGNPNKAYSSNIYLNFEFILECLNSNTDERGDISVYNFLKAICDGLNKALGGINNLEPVVDEETNTLSILDTSPIPGEPIQGQNYTLQLYGYDKDKVNGKGHISNFIRNVDLKTAITPEFATMITVGATAGGYVKGTEATAFSRWNVGLTDRFNSELLPGNVNSTPVSGSDEAVTNYNKKMASVPKITQFYGFSGNLQGGNSKNLKISTDAIETNISVGTEYYKYIIASNQTQNGGTVGFIPFKISFTMDGLSGIKIYNKLHVDTRFLPKAYGDALDLIVTGVSHKLQKNDWETDIEATVIPKTSGTTAYTPTIPNTQQSGSAPGSTPPTTGWEITHFFYPSLTTQKGKNIDIIIKAFKDVGVTNPYPIVAALCVIGKETGWTPQNEILNYTADRLPEVWAAFSTTGKVIKVYEDPKTGKKKPGVNGAKFKNKLAIEYAGNPQKLANFVYGPTTSTPKGMRAPDKNTQKTNPPGSVSGNKIWGDGFEYRGRGFNQITWKSTYEKYSKILGIDLIKYPDKLNDPDVAAKAAVIFFQNVFKYGGIKDPISYWNNYSSIDTAIVDFANANGGSINSTSATAIEASKDKRSIFNIITK